MDTTVTVVENESVGPDTYAVTFDSPEGFEAKPGQFVKISAEVEGEGYARFYTLSSPDTEETFETTIEVDEEGGPFSAHLAGLEAGDEVAGHITGFTPEAGRNGVVEIDGRPMYLTSSMRQKLIAKLVEGRIMGVRVSEEEESFTNDEGEEVTYNPKEARFE